MKLVRDVLARFPDILEKFNNSKFKKICHRLKKSRIQAKEGALITVPGTSDAYTEYNITDEIALELLIENPNRKVLFKVLPEDIDERIAGGLPDKKEDDADLVIIGTHKFEFDKAKEIFDKAGIKSGATTVKGLNKKVAALTADETKILVDAANSLIASIDVNESGSKGIPEADNAGKDNQGNESGTSEEGK